MRNPSEKWRNDANKKQKIVTMTKITLSSRFIVSLDELFSLLFRSSSNERLCKSSTVIGPRCGLGTTKRSAGPKNGTDSERRDVAVAHAVRWRPAFLLIPRTNPRPCWLSLT